MDVIPLRSEIALAAVVDPATTLLVHLVIIEDLTSSNGISDAAAGLNARLGGQGGLDVKMGELRLRGFEQAGWSWSGAKHWPTGNWPHLPHDEQGECNA